MSTAPPAVPPLDLLVLGSGVAGLSAAVRAATTPGMRVGVLTKAELHQSATRWAQGGVAAVLSTDEDSTDLHLAEVPGQRDDRLRAPHSAAVERGYGGHGRSPSSARMPATTRGSTSRKPSTCSVVVSRCTDTRTLPWVSTPIASSTWLGANVDEVHADPEATRRPRRSWTCCCTAVPASSR